MDRRAVFWYHCLTHFLHSDFWYNWCNDLLKDARGCQKVKLEKYHIAFSEPVPSAKNYFLLCNSFLKTFLFWRDNLDSFVISQTGGCISTFFLFFLKKCNLQCRNHDFFTSFFKKRKGHTKKDTIFFLTKWSPSYIVLDLVIE